jgi:hypothetical protein
MGFETCWSRKHDDLPCKKWRFEAAATGIFISTR